MRAPAKRYLRSLDGFSIPKSAMEPECVALLIQDHARLRIRESSAMLTGRPSWFGRLLWKLFGRWL